MGQSVSRPETPVKVVSKARYIYILASQELCQSRGGRPALPVPSLWEVKATLD